MHTRHVRGTVNDGGELVLTNPTALPPGEVDVILLYREPEGRLRRRSKKGKHPAFGIWADRPEAADPAGFAARLRQDLENRSDRRV
ncbi:MAG: hypothetical protein HYU66_28210 [Armatimonadetes bacterium]|nr:hypothetical protein [Armatimonadota bacterium]